MSKKRRGRKSDAVEVFNGEPPLIIEDEEEKFTFDSGQSDDRAISRPNNSKRFKKLQRVLKSKKSSLATKNKKLLSLQRKLKFCNRDLKYAIDEILDHLTTNEENKEFIVSLISLTVDTIVLRREISTYQTSLGNIENQEIELNNLYSNLNNEQLEVPPFFSSNDEETKDEGWSLWNLFKEG